jgi:hypothetical protein
MVITFPDVASLSLSRRNFFCIKKLCDILSKLKSMGVSAGFAFDLICLDNPTDTW